MKTVGVDAGKSGAIALLDGPKLVTIRDLPLNCNETLDSRLLFEWLMDWEPDYAVIESCFRPASLIRMCGEVAGVCKVLQVELLSIAVVTWKKKLLGENTSDKSKSIAKCQQLYPDAELTRPGGRKPNPDRAEAVLLAVFGRERNGK